MDWGYGAAGKQLEQRFAKRMSMRLAADPGVVISGLPANWGSPKTTLHINRQSIVCVCVLGGGSCVRA